MVLKENNMSGEISHLRDTFLSAEEEYAEKLISEPSWFNLVKKFNDEIDANILYRCAMKLINEVEYGYINFNRMHGVEKELIAILSAIKDVTLTKELVRTPNYEEEQTLIHTRHI